MSRAIRRLTLQSFRGATQPVDIALDTDKPLVVLFGENGCGKSSLIDAIDFVANESYGSLMNRSVGGLRHPFLASLGSDLADIEIGLQTQEGGVWRAKLEKTHAAVERTSKTGELPVVRVLRRAEILKIVEAKPAERYQELGRLIDVSSYQKSEIALREALRTAETSLQQAVARVEQASSSLEKHWEAEGSPGGSAAAWGKAKATEDVIELEQRETTLKSIKQAVESVKARRTEYGQALRRVRAAERALSTVRDEQKQLPSLDGANAVALVALLQQAKPLIVEGGNTTACPLCLQSIPGKELRASIEERLSKLDDYVQLGDRISQAEKNHASKVAVLSSSGTAILAALTKLAEATSKGSSELEAEGQKHPAILRDALGSCTAEISETAIRAGRKLCLALSSSSDMLAGISSDLAKHNAIRVQYNALVDAEKEMRRQDQLVARLKKTHETVEDTRKTFVDSILHSIGDECKALYARIHPEEKLGSPRLSMHESRPGSVELEGVFQDQTDIPPQGYYSESHLDTLGFCVWLAIAKRGDPGNTILLIDDVFTSVDAQHISRIVDLVSDIADEFAQVIVATHYRNWRDRYRLAHAPGLKAQLLELRRWTLARGISLSGTKLAVDELVEKCATDPLERQAVASQAGILLEAMLDYLSLLYRRRLPRNHDNEWTLGDLLSACRKLFGALQVERDRGAEGDGLSEDGAKEEDQPTAVTEAVALFYDETGRLVFLRNQVGCHFNLSGGEISNDDVRAFGEATSKLVRALSCEKCGEIPSRDKGDHFACSCGKTRMRPLEYDK
jgi:energy-coupling factor transporter ATP-binding protein EcfA2